MRIVYEFEDRLHVEGEIDLDPTSERAVRNAQSPAEVRDILDPLITDHALSDEQVANAGHHRSISFGVNGLREDG